MDRLKATPDNPTTTDPQLTSEQTQQITSAAQEYNLDPCTLLGLLWSEAGRSLSPTAERWGTFTVNAARIAVDVYYRGAAGSADALQTIINEAWPDISFGRSQAIVGYHPVFLTMDPKTSTTNAGTGTVAAVLTVREWAFAHPQDDLRLAAQKLAGCEKHPTYDGTPISACVIYNAGSDRRQDPQWMDEWSGNVLRYQENLNLAEQYRLNGVDTDRLSRALGGLWGIGNAFDPLCIDRRDEQHAYVLAVKEEVNRLLPESQRIP